MRFSIHFDNKMNLRTIEIHNEPSKNCLTPKFHSKLSAS